MFIRIFLILLLFTSSALWAKPGKEARQRHKITEANLYPVEINERHIKYAWIPKELEATCLDKSFETCEVLDQCRRNKELKCPKVSESLFYKVKKIVLKSPPTKVLTILHEHSPKDKISHLKPQKERLLDKVKAIVEWELWSNGESFTIKKFLKL